MITFGNDEQYSEGAVNDAIKAAAKATTGIDADEIKKELDKQHDEFENDDTPGYNRAIGYTNTVVDKGSEQINKKMDDILDKMAPHRYGSRSIIARSRNSILLFPVYITNTIRVNEAHVIAKMFERVYTTYVQTALNANPVISEDDVNDLLFLKQFHTNLKESGDLFFNEYYEPIDDLDQMLTEAVFYQEKISDTMDVVFRWIPCSDKDLINEAARLGQEPLAGLKYLSEAEKTKTEVTTKQVPIDEEEFRKIARANLPSGATSADIKTEVNRIKDEIKNDKGNKKYKNFRYDGIGYYRIFNTPVSSTEKTPDEDLRPVAILKDVDIKKINGMLPYTIEASFRVKPKEGASYVVRYIIGIKTNLHLIRPQDLAEDLEGLITGNIKSLRKIKYKTGEIKFNEYLFDIKNLKKNAAKRVDSNKKWINTLNRLAEFDKFNGSLLKKPAELINGEIPIPNSSIVLSQTDVSMLLNQTGIDLGQLSNARRLAKALFAISVAIIDASAGTMKVMFTDMGSDWDIQSIAAIDAEVSKTDNSAIAKELSKLINH